MIAEFTVEADTLGGLEIEAKLISDKVFSGQRDIEFHVGTAYAKNVGEPSGWTAVVRAGPALELMRELA